MSASVHILVEYRDGKPHLTLGPTPTVRAYTRKGSAFNYAGDLYADREYQNKRGESFGRTPKPPLDIRVLTVSIPDEGPVGNGFWPDILPELAVSWS